MVSGFDLLPTEPSLLPFLLLIGLQYSGLVRRINKWGRGPLVYAVVQE